MELTTTENLVIMLGFVGVFLGALTIGAHIVETVWPRCRRRVNTFLRRFR